MTEGPKRIQLSRKAGWRKPEGAVVVSRPSKWGNPYRVIRRNGHWMVQGNGSVLSSATEESFTKAEAVELAVEKYRDRYGQTGTNFAYEVWIALRGRDLACWCKIGQPCHADLLLQMANGDTW